MRRAWIVLLLCCGASAQNAQTASDGTIRFQANTHLVIEAVTITDRSGKPIEGLSPKDFTVTEDGVAQAISFCEFQRLTGATPPASEAPAARNGSARYRDRRLLALYFDMSAMPLADQMRAGRAAVEFIRNRMTASDLVAVLSFTDVVRVRQDFTDNRDLLLEAIQKLFFVEANNWFRGSINDDSTADYGSAFGEDDAEFNLFTIDRQLAALQTAVQKLGKLNEKKALIYFASGLVLNGTGNQAQLAATINSAIRANVSLYTVDARGLVATPPLGDATQGSQGGLAMYTGASSLSVASNLERSQDTLYALAADTGGKALVDNNDLALGIVNAQKAITSYYILGYYPTNPSMDGRYRRIKITYNGESSAKLDYRRGYFAGKQFSQFTAADKERQLQDALMLGDPITDLTIAAEVNYFQLNSAEYFVPVAVKIPASELALARRRGVDHTLIDFIGEVKDETDTTVANVRDKVDIKFRGETAAQLRKHPVQYDTAFTLLPGAYSLKLLARDAETGRIGTYLTKFSVPNLNKEQRRIATSSVVLSGQRIDVKEAVYTAGKNPAADAANPLIQDGRKLIPSVTRVFSRSREMLVYVQVYRVGASAAQPLFGVVTLYRGQKKALDTTPLAATQAMENKLKTVPFDFSVAVGKLQPGRYTCQVTIVDPTGRKAGFWHAPILLVP